MEAPSISSRSKSASYQRESRRHAHPSPSPLTGRRPSSRAQGLAPTSPEVISSLISSLSAISAEDFYDNLIPNASQKSAPASPSKSRNLRNEVIAEDPQPEFFLHPDDAAIPPVVRTSKPPSGLSPLTAPKKSPSQPPLLYTTSSTLSSDRGKPIGNVTVEPRHVPSMTSLNSVSTMKSKSIKSLNLKTSKERLRELDKEYKRRVKAEAAPKSPTFSMKGKGKMVDPTRIGEHGPPEIPSRTVSALSSNVARSASSARGREHESVSLGGTSLAVPERDSSMRHSFGTYGKRRTKPKRSSAPQLYDIYDPASDEKDKIFSDVLDLSIRDPRLIGQREALEKIQSIESTKPVSTRKQKPAPLTSPLPQPTKSKTKRSRPTSVVDVLGKENRNPDEGLLNGKRRDPLVRAVTEPLPVTTPTRRPDMAPSIADSIDEAVADYLANPRLSQKVKDPHTGRTISFSEVGDPNGFVVFVCLGMGTTRYLTGFYDEIATTLNLRLITPDRPGIGESEPYANGNGTPLAWPDDVRTICAHLGISRFSILAHSAGAIYALATALRMPQHIKGPIHLLAPWIPPSQMVAIGIQKDQVPNTSLPYSQRILRALPAAFFKAANSNILARATSSLASAMPSKSSGRAKSSKRRSTHASAPQSPSTSPDTSAQSPTSSTTPSAPPAAAVLSAERISEYDARLVTAIWDAATTHANPAVDLLVCLERRAEIGFRYADIAKEVVIHHGSRDSRVPVENALWLGRRMRRCGVRVLEGEGHGLMACAPVMADVLAELAGGWEDGKGDL